MEKIAYILSVYGTARAVILAADKEELTKKTAEALKQEVEPEGEVTVKIGDLGDWGEDTDVSASYVNEGQLIDNNDITLLKTIHY